MIYNIIQPPFTLQFREMSKTDLKAYFDWFLNQIPVRLPILQANIRATSGFEHWSADLTVESLKVLGDWYAGQIDTRARNQDELTEINLKLSFPMQISDQELTNKTFSLAFDMGMYFAEVLKNRFPNLHWELILKNKKAAEYGQPVLLGFKGDVPLNPVWIMVVLAYAIADKTKSGDRLIELYNYWSKQVLN